MNERTPAEDCFFRLPEPDDQTETRSAQAEAPAAGQRRVARLSGGGFSGGGILWGMFWDSYGAYLGQEQENVAFGTREAPLLYFRAVGNEAGQHGLTQEEMDSAVDVEGSLPAFARPREPNEPS